MRKVSQVITIVLGVLAMLVWLQGWWNGARPGGV
jgi:hypothetical protein